MSNITVTSNNPSYISSCWNTVKNNKNKIAAAVAVGVTAVAAVYTHNKNFNLLKTELADKCNELSSSSSAKNECEKAAKKVLATCRSINFDQCDQIKKDFVVLSDRTKQLMDSYGSAEKACGQFDYHLLRTPEYSEYCVEWWGDLVRECMKTDRKNFVDYHDWNIMKEKSCNDALVEFQQIKKIFDTYLEASNTHCSNLNHTKPDCMKLTFRKASDCVRQLVEPCEESTNELDTFLKSAK